MYRLWTTPVTDQFGDQLEHHVPDTEAVVPMHGGAMRTVCGRFITPAAMIAPEGKPCPRCAANLGLLRQELSRRDVRAKRHGGCLPRFRRLKRLFDW